MRTIITLLLITIISYGMYGQDVVRLKGFYAGEGVIFNERTKNPLDIKHAVKYYTPTIEDIKKAEMLTISNDLS